MRRVQLGGSPPPAPRAHLGAPKGVGKGKGKRDGVSPEGLHRLLEDLRTNMMAAIRRVTMQDLVDCMHFVVKLHKERTLVDRHDLDGPGTVPNPEEFQARCSLVNLSKLAIIAKYDEDLMNDTLVIEMGREADGSVNSMVGRNLSGLVDELHAYEADVHYTRRESVRLVDLEDEEKGLVRMRICQWHLGRGCVKGMDCPMVHLGEY